MFTSMPFDAIVPFIATFSLSTFLIATVIIVIIEAGVMFWLKWDTFRGSVWASLIMNGTSAVFGCILMLLYWANWHTTLLITFVLSVLIEGGVLMLMRRNAGRKNWTASLLANLTSYLLIALCIWLFSW